MVGESKMIIRNILLIASLAGLWVVGGYLSKIDEDTTLFAALAIIQTALAIYIFYYVAILISKVRKLPSYSSFGLLIFLAASVVFHILGLILISVVDPSSAVPQEYIIAYSIDQTMKGVALDILEGLRVNVSDIVPMVFDYQITVPTVEPRSSTAVFDMVYRSIVTTAVSVYIARVVSPLFGVKSR